MRKRDARANVLRVYMGFMVSADRLLAFSVMSFLLIVIPGPSVLFVIGRALAQGHRAALTTVMGNTLGAYVLVVAVAFGIGSIVERSALVFTALKLMGAAYLVYLGVKAVRQRRSLHAAFTAEGPAHGSLRTLWEGFTVGVTNPKTMCSSRPYCRSSSTAAWGTSRFKCCFSDWSSMSSRWPQTACGDWSQPPRGAGSPAHRSGSPWSVGSAGSR
jgi:hypothetical protein